jgi:hypothetical protein
VACEISGAIDTKNKPSNRRKMNRRMIHSR